MEKVRTSEKSLHRCPGHPCRVGAAWIALNATRQNKNSLSAANKLLIRCAWAGNLAFASAGFGGSTWAPGSCS